VLDAAAQVTDANQIDQSRGMWRRSAQLFKGVFTQTVNNGIVGQAIN